MVEMRWVKKRDQYYEDGLPTGHLGPVREVLQYRQRVVKGAWALQPPPNAPTEWSEWIDVPTVTEEKCS